MSKFYKIVVTKTKVELEFDAKAVALEFIQMIERCCKEWNAEPIEEGDVYDVREHVLARYEDTGAYLDEYEFTDEQHQEYCDAVLQLLDEKYPETK